MSDQLSPDLEARLDAWLADRAPSDVPTSFARRIAGIPQSSGPVLRGAPRIGTAFDRRSPTALLVAAAIALMLALVAGGLFFAASLPDRSLTVVTSPSPTATDEPGPSQTATAATPPPVAQTAPPTFAGLWPVDFRSSGVLPATVDRDVDHGTIDTPIGRARWIHLRGDGTSLPDPLVPILAPDGKLVWFAGGGPGDACFNEPTSSTCSDPPAPSLTVSADVLAPRVSRALPVDVAEAGLWLDEGTYWLTSADPPTVWSSHDLDTWQETDLSGLQSPGPASIEYRMSVSPTTTAGDGAVASIEYTAADAGSLVGHPGVEVHLVKDGAGYLVREHHPRSEGGDKDLEPVTVRETKDGIRFEDSDGLQVGRVDGVGPEFAEMWADRGIIYRQLAVLDGGHWTPVELPVAPLVEWPSLVRLGDGFLLLVVEPDQRIRAWRTTDGHAWSGGEVLLTDDGTPMRSTGTTYRDADGGRIVTIFGSDDTSGWESTDGITWTPATFRSGEVPATQIAEGWLRTADQTEDGSWLVSIDGSAWEPVPALHEVIDKIAPLGAGGSSESVVGNTLFFSVDEAEAPFVRDVWMVEFEQPPS